MKKSAIYLLTGALLFTGCKKKTDDTIKGETADQRLSAVMAAYQAKLTSAANGWILIEFTTGSAINQGATTTGQEAAFAYYMQFADSNTVTMFSDFDSTMAVTPKTSSYRLKAVQRPTLIFDTYSYIHIPADPDPAISKSPFGPGLGWGADFEFSFADNEDPSQLGDTIHLTGNLNGANAILIKATQADHDAYYSGAVANAFDIDRILNYFKRVTAGSTVFEITPGIATKIIDVSWLDGGTLKRISTPIYFRANGIVFETPITVGSETVTGINNIIFNPANATATATINGTVATIAGAVAPLKVDLSAPANWYNSANSTGGLWISLNGFHVNGVDDAFNLESLTDHGSPYFGYTYYPGEASGNYDIFSPLFFIGGNSVNFSQDYISFGLGQEASSGITYFTMMDAGAAPPAAVANSNTLLTDPAGYYFVAKGDSSVYDMVIASDAKSWIRWDFMIY